MLVGDAIQDGMPRIEIENDRLSHSANPRKASVTPVLVLVYRHTLMKFITLVNIVWNT